MPQNLSIDIELATGALLTRTIGNSWRYWRKTGSSYIWRFQVGYGSKGLDVGFHCYLFWYLNMFEVFFELSRLCNRTSPGCPGRSLCDRSPDAFSACLSMGSIASTYWPRTWAVDVLLYLQKCSVPFARDHDSFCRRILNQRHCRKHQLFPCAREHSGSFVGQDRSDPAGLPGLVSLIF